MFVSLTISRTTCKCTCNTKGVIWNTFWREITVRLFDLQTWKHVEVISIFVGGIFFFFFWGGGGGHPVHHHKTECFVKRLHCCVQGQGHSDEHLKTSLNVCQSCIFCTAGHRMFVSPVFSVLLVTECLSVLYFLYCWSLNVCQSCIFCTAGHWMFVSPVFSVLLVSLQQNYVLQITRTSGNYIQGLYI